MNSESVAGAAQPMNNAERVAAVFHAHQFICEVREASGRFYAAIPFRGDNCSFDVQVFSHCRDEDNYTVAISGTLVTCPKGSEDYACRLINDLNRESPFLTFFMEEDRIIRGRFIFAHVPDENYGEIIFDTLTYLFMEIDQTYYFMLVDLLRSGKRGRRLPAS